MESVAFFSIKAFARACNIDIVLGISGYCGC